MFFIWILNLARWFFSVECYCWIRRGRKNSIVRLAHNRQSRIFCDTISKHCKWIILQGPAFINESGHIKTLKKIARTVDFCIPKIKKNLNKKRFWRTVGIIEILHNSTITSGYSWWFNQLIGSMNKCSVFKKPHLCIRLILSKVSCFGVKAS